METRSRYCKLCEKDTTQRWDGIKSGGYSFGYYKCYGCSAKSGAITRDRNTGVEVEDRPIRERDK